MNAVGLALRELHRSENALAEELLRLAQKHKVDHEVYHLAEDLARWSQQHVREIAAVASRFGEELDPEPAGDRGLVGALREKAGEAMGRASTPALLLLRDLRAVYLSACGVSVDWELVGQAAQGLRDAELLALSTRCHPETVRQMHWANGKLKESATQALVS